MDTARPWEILCPLCYKSGEQKARLFFSKQNPSGQKAASPPRQYSLGQDRHFCLPQPPERSILGIFPKKVFREKFPAAARKGKGGKPGNLPRKAAEKSLFPPAVPQKTTSLSCSFSR
jgi:hypothetical protein